MVNELIILELEKLLKKTKEENSRLTMKNLELFEKNQQLVEENAKLSIAFDSIKKMSCVKLFKWKLKYGKV